jgi:hypothetical protein
MAGDTEVTPHHLDSCIIAQSFTDLLEELHFQDYAQIMGYAEVTSGCPNRGGRDSN